MRPRPHHNTHKLQQLSLNSRGECEGEGDTTHAPGCPRIGSAGCPRSRPEAECDHPCVHSCPWIQAPRTRVLKRPVCVSACVCVCACVCACVCVSVGFRVHACRWLVCECECKFSTILHCDAVGSIFHSEPKSISLRASFWSSRVHGPGTRTQIPDMIVAIFSFNSSTFSSHSQTILTIYQHLMVQRSTVWNRTVQHWTWHDKT